MKKNGYHAVLQMPPNIMLIIIKEQLEIIEL